jgi:gag-polyprotein putative aspartyl protease
VDHPVAAVELAEPKSDMEEGSEEDGEFAEAKDPMEGICGALAVLTVEESVAILGDRTVTLDAKVNGKNTRVVIDSGASKSLCSTRKAKELGLELTGAQFSFRGLGHNTGAQCKPTVVEFPGRSETVTFCAVNQQDLPTLIGAGDLRRMDVLIDPQRNQLLDRRTFNVVAAAEEIKRT